MTTTKLPLSELSQANPEWLTQTLTANGHLIQGRVAYVVREPWRKSAHSYIARLRVGYSADATCKNGAVPPAELVLKFNQPIGAKKRSSLYAQRENEFYSRIARAMNSPPVARCYDSVFEPRSGRSHFLLEDLSRTHTHVDGPLPPSAPDCEQIVECLARFHATWWNDPRVGTEIGGPFHEARWSKRATSIRKRTDEFVAFIGDRISASRRDVLLNLCAVFPRLLERQGTGHLTIAHGDTHFQNFLVAPGRADCRIIDWEAWEVAPATDDLAFMIAVQWFAERRQRLEQDLLHRYHRTLVAAGVNDYSWDALWADYRLSVVKRLCVPVYQWADGIWLFTWWNDLERILMAYEDLRCAEIMEQLKASRSA